MGNDKKTQTRKGTCPEHGPADVIQDGMRRNEKDKDLAYGPPNWELTLSCGCEPTDEMKRV